MRSVLERIGITTLLALAACNENPEDGAEAVALESSTGIEAESSSTTDLATETTGVPDVEATSSEGSSTGAEVPSAIPSRECPPDSFLTATNFGMPFLSTWCTGCHSTDLIGATERQNAPEQFDFDTIESVRANLEYIYQDAGDTNVLMPPAGGPSAEEREWLGEWLACGAP